MASGIEQEPQSWNRYTYCLNHPLKFTDPTGLVWGHLSVSHGSRYLWFANEAAMEAAGATAVESNAIRNGFVYEAENGKFIRLDLNQNSWSSFDSWGEANLGRTYAQEGSSSLGDLGSTLGLFAGVEAGAGLAVRLGAAALGRMFGLEIATLGAAGATGSAARGGTAEIIKGLSKNSLNHLSKHLDEFRKLNPSMTLEDMVGLGQKITGKQGNLIGTPGGRKVFEEAVEIGGKQVRVRAVLNTSGQLRSVHIRR